MVIVDCLKGSLNNIINNSSNPSCPQVNPMNRNNDKYLRMSKSNHHPTNKKPHECGALIF